MAASSDLRTTLMLALLPVLAVLAVVSTLFAVLCCRLRRGTKRVIPRLNDPVAMHHSHPSMSERGSSAVHLEMTKSRLCWPTVCIVSSPTPVKSSTPTPRPPTPPLPHLSPVLAGLGGDGKGPAWSSASIIAIDLRIPPRAASTHSQSNGLHIQLDRPHPYSATALSADGKGSIGKAKGHSRKRAGTFTIKPSCSPSPEPVVKERKVEPIVTIRYPVDEPWDGCGAFPDTGGIVHELDLGGFESRRGSHIEV
ncbi:hypothetical protein BKA62DRAFT_813859 [Auriculariales sp. MPI-PUGE-AT-0066]|nr:hypothetical protein BKA62DRAFT_813859 [Auriculariales sp. MPI-PUGE-AT-0066]